MDAEKYTPGQHTFYTERKVAWYDLGKALESGMTRDEVRSAFGEWLAKLGEDFRVSSDGPLEGVGIDTSREQYGPGGMSMEEQCWVYRPHLGTSMLFCCEPTGWRPPTGLGRGPGA